MNEPFSRGIFPTIRDAGVLVVEALAQIASILAWRIVGLKPGAARTSSCRDRQCALPADGASR
jgi:hypothetical protein